MERRGSNVDASAVRAPRRRSAVTIIAPGEETNPFQPDPVNTAAPKDSLPADARFDDFKANPHVDDVTVNAGPAPVPHGPSPPPPLAPSAIASVPAPANRTPNHRNGGGGSGTAPDTLHTSASASRSAGSPADGSDEAATSASKRIRGLHMFPNTPPTTATTAVMPAQRPVSVRNGNVLVASVPRGMAFPANPNAARPAMHGPASAQQQVSGAAFPNCGPGQTVPYDNTPTKVANGSRQRQTPPVDRRTATPRAAGDVPVSQRGSGAFSPSTQGSGTYVNATRRPAVPQPVPSPSSARWTSASRRQPLNTSAPTLPTPSNYYNPAAPANKSNAAGRRATVPQGGVPLPPSRRVELMSVPHPPSRHANTNGGDASSASPSSSTSPDEPNNGNHASSPLIQAGDSGSVTGPGNDSFNQAADTSGELSIVIEDSAGETSEAAAVSPVPQSSPPPPQTRRVESPPADNSDFLKPTAHRRPATIDMAPLSPQKKPTRSEETADASKSSDGGNESPRGKEDGDDEDPPTTSNGSKKKDAEEVSNPFGRQPSPDESEQLSMSSISADVQSPLNFTPFQDRRTALQLPQTQKTPSDRIRAPSADPADTSAVAPNETSTTDFGLTNRDTVEPLSLGTSKVVTTTTTAVPASTSQRHNHPALHLPSPVDLNSMLLSGASNSNGRTSSPLLDASKHRTNLERSHGSQSNDGRRSSRSAMDDGKGHGSRKGPTTPATERSLSVGDWSFDHFAKNGLSRESEESELITVSPQHAAAAPSPVASRSGNSSSGHSGMAEEKWRVTQSLSINPAEFSFDRLPLNQQSSNVAKLRKVFESQRKPRRDVNVADASKTVPAWSPPVLTESPRKRSLGVASPLPQTDSLALSSGDSTVIAPRSERSSKTSFDEDAREDSGSSAVERNSAYAPSMEFSFDGLIPPASPEPKSTLPPIVRNGHTKPQVTSTNTNSIADDSAADLRFSWGVSMEGGSPMNRHSAPTRTPSAKATNTFLPAVSLPVSDGGFSLARFQNSAASVDSVNMSDRYDF